MSQQVGKLNFFGFFICLFLLSADFSVHVALGVSPLQTWETSSDTLTGSTSNAYSAYNGDSSYPECVFVFGGNGCTDCDTLFCYNITSDILENFGSIGTDLSTDERRGRARQNAFVISDGTNDLLYYITDDGDVYYHDINIRDSTDVLKTSFDVRIPAMVKHPDDTEFYVFGFDDDTLYGYDLIEDEHYQGDSLNYARQQPGVIVNEYYDDPYIYIMGGYSSYIERLNINDARNNEWELLLLLLQSGIDEQFSVTVSSYRSHSIVSYENYIYLIGGYDGSYLDDIILLDVANWEISWAGVFPTNIVAMATAVAQDRVYTFGGSTGSSSGGDEIYISNSFDEIDETCSCCSSYPSSETTQYPYQVNFAKQLQGNNILDLVIQNTKMKQQIFAFELVLTMIGLYFGVKLVLSKCTNNKKNWTVFNRYEYESIN